MSKTLRLRNLSAIMLALTAMIVLTGCPAADEPAVQPSEEPTTTVPAAEESAVVEPFPEGPVLDEPAAVPPVSEEPVVEEPVVEEPVVEEPPLSVEEPVMDRPGVVLPPPIDAVPVIDPPPVDATPVIEPPPVDATPDQPAVVEPAPEEPVAVEPVAVDPVAVEHPAVHPVVVDPSKPLKKAELLAELPDEYNTPDGMCLLPNGDVLLAVPNVNVFLAAEDKSKQDPPAVILKITKDNKIEKYYDPPLHPVTGCAFPFGMCVDPEGKNLYITDLQWFANTEEPGNNSRVLRIPIDENCNPAGDPVVVIEGLVVANAVIIRDGYLYVSDTCMVPKTNPADPQVTGVFRVKLDEEGTKLPLPLLDDPHLIATMETHNQECTFGADGLTFDSKGNLYCGNFGDGTLHIIKFDENRNPIMGADGKPMMMEVFTKAPYMKSCDGIFCDLKTDKIYVADSIANAVQIVSPDGSVQTLAVDEENDGSGGRLDQPCEVLLRGNEVIVSNMDFPVPGGVNKTFDKPYTISIIKLD